MSSRNRLNVIFPGGIGTAGKFKTITKRFVRSEPKEGSLGDGFLLLRMTANELLRVHSIMGELQRSSPDGFTDLQSEYHFLIAELEALQRQRKSTSVWNVSKRNKIQQDAEELYIAGDELYHTVKAVSNHAEKELEAFRIAKARVNEVEATEIAANEQVMGYSLDGPLQVDPDQASTFTYRSLFTSLDGLSIDSMSLGDADGHGDIPPSDVVSGAKHMMPEASSVLAARADSATVDGWLQDRLTRDDIAGGDVPGCGAAPQNGTSSSSSPVNSTGNHRIPPPVPNPVGDSIPDFGFHPGVQNVPSGSSPTVPHPPSDNLPHRVADLEARFENLVAKPQFIINNNGPMSLFQDFTISPNAAHTTLMKDGNSNKGPKHSNAAPNPQQAGLGAQGAGYPTPPHSPARSPGEPIAPLSGPPRQWSAFQGFQTNRDAVCNSSLYTIIDGESHGSGLQAAHFIQTAEVLRETTKLHVIKIVRESKGLSDSEKETCINLVRDVPILPGLVAYIYTHLIVCPRRGWIVKDNWTNHLSNLETEVNYWRGISGIQCVLFYDTVKSSLIEILDAVPTEQHTCNSALLDGTMLIKQDIQNLAALVALCITGPDKDKILRAKENKAAILANLLHALLDAGVELDDWCRRCLFDALISLTKVTGHCPPSLYLNEDIISDLVPCNRGGFGIVSKGKIGSRVVAVKYLKRDDRAGSHDEYDKDLCKEAIVWRHLRHPNCLPLYGVYKDGPTVTAGLVSPWMHHGTLFNYLESTPTPNRTILILDMVRGLNYLHSMRPHVAHRDIKPANILVTKQGRACLADFGLVSVFDMDPQFRTTTAQLKMIGTRSYTAPEIFTADTEEDNRKVNKRWSDMYSLGCTIYATYTGNHPFHDVRPELIPDRVVSHQRPPFPEGQILHEMWGFIQNLWQSEPSERLTAKKALAWMEFEADRQGIDTSVPAFEEEWLWKGSQTGGPLSVA